MQNREDAIRAIGALSASSFFPYERGTDPLFSHSIFQTYSTVTSGRLECSKSDRTVFRQSTSSMLRPFIPSTRPISRIPPELTTAATATPNPKCSRFIITIITTIRLPSLFTSTLRTVNRIRLLLSSNPLRLSKPTVLSHPTSRSFPPIVPRLETRSSASSHPEHLRRLSTHRLRFLHPTTLISSPTLSFPPRSPRTASTEPSLPPSPLQRPTRETSITTLLRLSRTSRVSQGTIHRRELRW